MLYWGLVLLILLILGAVYVSDGQRSLVYQNEVSLNNLNGWAFFDIKTSIAFISYLHNSLVINFKNQNPIVEVIDGGVNPSLGSDGHMDLVPSKIFSAEIANKKLIVKRWGQDFFVSQLKNVGHNPKIDLITEVMVEDDYYLLVTVRKNAEQKYLSSGQNVPLEVLIFQI